MTARSSRTSPVLPWKTRIKIALISSFSDMCRRYDNTVNRGLTSFLDLKAPPNANPVNGVKTLDLTVDASRDLWFRIFLPTEISGGGVVLPVMVFFHGGGFAFLRADARDYDAICRKFARSSNAVIVSVNYRLTPEHRFPCQYDDGFDVLRFLDSEKAVQILPENADLSKVFLAGDSAGANLAHHVAKRASETEDFKKLKVAGLIAIQPFFGGEERTESELRLTGSPLISVSRTDWLWKIFLPEETDRDHEVVNVSGPNAADISRLAKFPKTLVFIGGFDPLKDWQMRYYEWLKRSGKDARLVEYPDAIHAFYVFAELPETPLLFSEVRDFITEVTSSSYSHHR